MRIGARRFGEDPHMADKIKSQDASLEEAIQCYEEGMKYYKICSDILDNAKQKIETFEGEV